jgi:hypothetical protein
VQRWPTVHIGFIVKQGKYTILQGIVERGEDPFDATKPEFTEETGLELPQLMI